MFEKTECNIRETLSQANREFNEKYAKLKSEHSLKNLQLQNERHKIFEAYRNSGGKSCRRLSADVPGRMVPTKA